MVDLTMTLLTFRPAKPALLLLSCIISAVSEDAARGGDMKTVTVSSFHPASDRPRRSLHHDGHGFYPQDSDSLQVLDEVVDSSSNSWRAEGKEVALSIAQDVIRIGPFAAIHRFSTRAHRREEAFRGADGVLGLAYSAEPNSASVLKSLSEGERKEWHVEEPKNFRRMERKMFTIVAGEEGGELQVDGYDDAATQDGAVSFLEVADSSGYSVVIGEIRYGRHVILSSSAGAGAGGVNTPRATQLIGAFDTGSSCLELPDSAVAGLSVSPFRVLLDAHMRYGRQELSFDLEDSKGGKFVLKLPYEAWTHPHGCLGPYAGKRIIFGDPVFRRYMIVHDFHLPSIRVGLALLDPRYKMLRSTRYKEEETRSGKIVKIPLEVDTSRPARRYLLQVGLGSPVQSLKMLVDTGSFLTEVFTCPPCHDEKNEKSSSSSDHMRGRKQKLEKKEVKEKHRASQRQTGEVVKGSDEIPGIQAGGVIVMLSLVVCVGIAEWRRRKVAVPKFRLVEYSQVEGEPSKFEFSDL
uniref:Peptidase A1 domain-containing protein n=1 Tax=Guillardia theta TaxID=55529 RepID=A0A6U6C116_GUITH|mmetsp:Transcript_39712/g.124752  ORF Transcript_39712/g.124752 Transcript_39712/m.124752 type:complete len:520 (+) Transcript_39712:70-1629(+)